MNNEMLDGYLDGFNLDSPHPGVNRSYNYRHGFSNGRADANNTVAFASASVAIDMAKIAVKKDETTWNLT